MSFVYESNEFSMVQSIMDRGQFSHAAARALLEWLEELAEAGGDPIELDPVGLRCEWSEYETVVKMVEDMGWGDHVVLMDGEFDPEETLENIEHHEDCTIIRVDRDGPFLVHG
jgi:hypothetical protein